MSMTYDEIATLIASGDWKEEVLAESETQELVKNINRFKYFTLEAYYMSEDGSDALCGRFFFSRDYINKWVIKDNGSSMTGNFGDGSKLVVTDRVIAEGSTYKNIYVKHIYGYRPTRKTIYVYKVDPNTYLLTKDEEYLYTSEGLKIATADMPE